MEIRTNKRIGDKVWWVHRTKDRWRIFEGTIEDISLCEYQGALYCHLYSPAFKVNPHPTVHYSYVFCTKEEAESHREVLKASDNSIPMCDGCKYAWRGRGV